jgi:hypothetical protein
MKLKEKIYHSIKKMTNDELWLVYEQIQVLQQTKHILNKKTPQINIEDILKMTSSDTGCWSDSIIKDRMERL